MNKSFITATAAIAMVAISLVGCSSNNDATTSSIKISDEYVKTASMKAIGIDKAMDPMSAAFMTITNDTDTAVKLVGGSTDIAKKIEIHEVVDGVMRPIEGGLVISNGESSVLKPGGNHVMLIGLTKDLKVGDEVALTLNFSNGDKVSMTAPVKEIPAGDEPYSSATPTATKK